MTPTQKIKWLVLAVIARYRNEEAPPYPCADVDALYDAAEERDETQDAEAEVRASGHETGIATNGSSRYYEKDAVAAPLPDGSWVGWTYWHGGGKHSEPGAIEWMEDAYDVTSREETRVVRVFERVADPKKKEGGGRDPAALTTTEHR